MASECEHPRSAIDLKSGRMIGENIGNRMLLANAKCLECGENFTVSNSRQGDYVQVEHDPSSLKKIEA